MKNFKSRLAKAIKTHGRPIHVLAVEYGITPAQLGKYLNHGAVPAHHRTVQAMEKLISDAENG